MKLALIRTNFKTTGSKWINHTKFVYCSQETFKISVRTTKSRLPVNSRYKFCFFRKILLYPEMTTFDFFPVERKKTVLDDKFVETFCYFLIIILRIPLKIGWETMQSGCSLKYLLSQFAFFFLSMRPECSFTSQIQVGGAHSKRVLSWNLEN